MKFSVTILLAFFSITNANAQIENGFRIKCNIQGVPDGTIFYLIKNTGNGRADTMYTAQSQNSSFVIKGQLKKEGELVFVKMDTSVVKMNDDRHSWARLLLHHSDIVLNGTLEQWPKVHIEGSEPTKEFEMLSEFYRQKRDSLKQDINAVTGDSLKIERLNKQFREFLIESSLAYSDSYAMPLFLNNFSELDWETKGELFEKLSPRVKNGYYAAVLTQRILTNKKRTEIGIGKLIPEISVEDPSGRKVAVREIAKQAKYTLLDFWAYWCSPCKADVPDMKKTYEAFHKKGFNILGISVDPDKEKWKKAITTASMPWQHGIDLDESSKILFGISPIPAYILIDNEARIVALDYVVPAGFTANISGQTVQVVRSADVFKNSLRKEKLYQYIEGLFSKKVE